MNSAYPSSDESGSQAVGSIPDAASASEDTTLARGRWIAVALGAAAIVALSVAIVLNGLWVMQWGPRTRTFAEAAGGRSLQARYEPSAMPAMGTPALNMLSPTVIQYETMARHNVPGKGASQAEAIYASLNMDMAGSVPVSIYARAEGFPSPDQARERLAEFAKQYPAKARQATISELTPAYEAYSADETVYVLGWVKDSYFVYVKSTFLRTPPVEKKTYLLDAARPIATACDIYQRTGKSGIEVESLVGGVK